MQGRYVQGQSMGWWKRKPFAKPAKVKVNNRKAIEARSRHPQDRNFLFAWQRIANHDKISKSLKYGPAGASVSKRLWG